MRKNEHFLEGLQILKKILVLSAETVPTSTGVKLLTVYDSQATPMMVLEEMYRHVPQTINCLRKWAASRRLRQLAIKATQVIHDKTAKAELALQQKQNRAQLEKEATKELNEVRQQLEQQKKTPQRTARVLLEAWRNEKRTAEEKQVPMAPSDHTAHPPARLYRE